MNKETFELMNKTIRNWWSGLERRRGDRAGLRRCTDHRDAAFQPGYWHLRQALEDAGCLPEKRSDNRLCFLAALLPHVRQHHHGEPIGKTFASPAEGNPVSKLRFRRLMEKEDLEELFPTLQRTLKIVKGRINIYDLTYSIFHWNAQTRRKWARDYYGTLFQQPKNKK